MSLVRLTFVVAVFPLLTACAGRGVPDTLDPVAADRAVRETAPDRPLRGVFGWRVLDGEARFDGDGVARIEPSYRARLDLFGPRGDGYLSAALVDGDIRLPSEPEVPLPPPAMVWAVLGVVRPPMDATLLGTRAEGTRLELHYDVEGSRLRYLLIAERLVSVEWRGRGRHMIIELTNEGDGSLPLAAAYRDWSRNTELHIELEDVEEVESYPPDIWDFSR